ncbi:MAG: GAF domain-containing protein, partial [Acidobacteria bacterium]|nr:GAF domain-containing protein [Acidobacteriota bacterium]
MDKQVWYFSDSPAASLIGSLPPCYIAKAVSRTRPFSTPPQIRLVWLADLDRDAKDLDGWAQRNSQARVVYVLPPDTNPPAGNRAAFAYLPPQPSPAFLDQTLASAFENMELAARAARAEEQLARSSHEINELNRIGVALSSERDPQRLLNLILQASREITSSDAGSLYLVEDVSEKEKRLRFKLTQNDSAPVGFTEFTVPMDRSSIAGYVAVTGEVLPLADTYEIPPDAPYRFNRRFDEETGYRTKSMLTIPMQNQQGEILGVLQLIN